MAAERRKGDMLVAEALRLGVLVETWAGWGLAVKMEQGPALGDPEPWDGWQRELVVLQESRLPVELSLFPHPWARVEVQLCPCVLAVGIGAAVTGHR